MSVFGGADSVKEVDVGTWGELTACATYQFSAGQTIHRVALCANVPGLILLGGKDTVEVVWFESLSETEARLKRTNYRTKLLRKYYIGSRACALDWCFSTVLGQDGSIYFEFFVACQDRQIRYVSGRILSQELQDLTYSSEQEQEPEPEQVFKVFGSGTSGHRSRINDLACCPIETFHGIIATASDDSTCLIWNIHANESENNNKDSTTNIDDSMEFVENESMDKDPNSFTPISSPIVHSHPVLGVSFHKAHASLLMTFDVTATVRLIDWVKPDRPVVLSLIDPVGMSRMYASTGSMIPRRGGMDWLQSDPNLVGASIESRWMLWDLSKGEAGGRPVEQGEAFVDGSDRFKSSAKNSRLIAISTSGEKSRGRIKVIDTMFPASARVVYETHTGGVEDIAWHPTEEVLCATLGDKLRFYDCRT